MTLVYRDDRAVNHLRKQIIYHSMELENSGHYDSSAGNIEEMTFGNSREDFLRKSDGTSKPLRVRFTVLQSRCCPSMEVLFTMHTFSSLFFFFKDTSH